MEFTLSVLGILLAAVGLIYAFIAHPTIVERINSRPTSLLARISRFVLLSRRQLQRAPAEITLYDVLYDREYRSELEALIDEAQRKELSDFLGVARNWRFLLEDEFRLALEREKIPYIRVLASLIIEFASHNFIIAKGINVPRKELALRIGYFVTASKEGTNRDIIYLHGLTKIGREIAATDGWSSARNRYFICRMLPFRHVFQIDFAMAADDLGIVKREIERLRLSIFEYLISATDLSLNTRRENANIAKVLSNCVQELLYGKKYERGKLAPLSSGEMSILAELAISYSHKILFGQSAMAENAIVPMQVYRELDEVWNARSRELASASRRPTASLRPSQSE